MIPVEFTYEGKVYKGYLTPVSGTANNTYYLEVNKRYCGSLILVEDNPQPLLPRDLGTAKYKWKFTSQTGKLDHLEPVFIEAIEKAQL